MALPGFLPDAAPVRAPLGVPARGTPVFVPPAVAAREVAGAPGLGMPVLAVGVFDSAVPGLDTPGVLAFVAAVFRAVSFFAPEVRVPVAGAPTRS